MHETMATLIDRMDSCVAKDSCVIEWSSPVPVFGDIGKADIATVGINPSYREFVDESGRELYGKERRFPTLRSMALEAWSDATSRHIAFMTECCSSYFHRNPYNRWFGTLEKVLWGAKASFYGILSNACHIDLVPYATSKRWGDLSGQQQSALRAATSDVLRGLLQKSSVRSVILNGQSVVAQFEHLSGIQLSVEEMPSWALSRTSGADVPGKGYIGLLDRLDDTPLERRLLVLGFNHNLQSSFGVRTDIIESIRDWVTQHLEEDIK